MSYPGGGHSGVEWIDPVPASPDDPPAMHGDPVAPPWRRLRFRTWMVIAAVAVLTVAGVGVWYAVKPQRPVRITYHGAVVDNAAALLKTTDAAFLRYAHAQLGTVSRQTRCYFQRAGGAPASDVSSSLYCGPALFFNGSTARPYLTYYLFTRPGHGARHVTLTTDGPPDASSPDAAPTTLERTDRRKPPLAAGGLVVPVPPPASANVLAAISDDDALQLAGANPDALMVGHDAGVRLRSYGVIPSYGHAAQARSAAAGRQLIGFAISETSGEMGSDPSKSTIGVAVNGGSVRRLPPPPSYGADAYYVVSVPVGATAVDVVLSERYATQRISLLTGEPAESDIAVLRRTGTDDSIEQDGHAVARVDDSGDVYTAALNIHVSDAYLRYFSDYRARPSGPQRAFLYVDLCYRSTAMVDPTYCYGFRGTDMQLTPTGGKPITGRDIGDAQHTYPVFDVPAGFTTGTVTLTGTESSTDGWQLTITQPYSFPVSFLE